jgi:hypothetical protein
LVAEVMYLRDNQCGDVPKVMKFGARYEILRALTRGDVETFAVRDRATGEKALAHIFECPEAPLDQPTVQWVLTSFSQLAPETPGPVTDVGRYDIASFAYIVSRWPADEAVDTWIQQYRDRGDSSKTEVASDSPHSAPKEEPPPPPPSLTPEQPKTADNSQLAGSETQVPQREPGEFTRQFFGGIVFPGEHVFAEDKASTEERSGHQDDQTIGPGESQSVTEIRQAFAGASTPLAGTGPEEPSRERGDFTRQFFREINPPPESPPEAPVGVPAQPDSTSGLWKRDPLPSVTVTDAGGKNWAPDSKPGEFTNEFMRDFGPVIPLADQDAMLSQEPAKLPTGEFTRLFRMPVPRDEGESTTREGHPSESRSAGEFTRIFGPSVPDAHDEVPSHLVDNMPEVTPAKGSSTDPFGITGFSERRSGEESYTAGQRSPLGKVEESGATHVFAGTREHPEYSDRTPSREPFAAPDLSSDNRIPDPGQFHVADGGATVLFNPPAEVATEREPGVPAGPSDYTMFMNREAISALASGSAEGLPASGAPPAGAPAPAAASPFATAPAVPPLQVPVPKIPTYQAPPVPVVAPPAMPAIAPPAIGPPAVPAAAGQPSAGPKSYWPLIIILNVLFILAVLLILYFALKH